MNTPDILVTPNAVRSNATRLVYDASQQNDVRQVIMVGNGSDTSITGTVEHKVYDELHAPQAQQRILQLLNVHRTAPCVIIIRYHEAVEKDCVQWKSFFELHSILRTIPFFLLTDKVDDALKAFVKQYRFIDEVITDNSLDQNIFTKVDFIRRIKRPQAPIPAAQQDEPVKATYRKSRVDAFLKRTLDITAASVGLIVASPVMLVVAALIRLESKGPIFYAAPRAGRNYKVFKFYKFRTMVPDADKMLDKIKHLNQYDTSTNGNGPTFVKVSNDPRVTKLGNFLRNSSLDELPQLLNVLKGDMSLVGNRPLPLYEATTLTTDEWAERFLAPAGITGLWQITKRGKKEMSVEERINLDINYAEKHSFTYDMWLIVNTPFALIQKDNV